MEHALKQTFRFVYCWRRCLILLQFISTWTTNQLLGVFRVNDTLPIISVDAAVAAVAQGDGHVLESFIYPMSDTSPEGIAFGATVPIH